MFSSPRLKIHLKLMINRLKLVKSKKEAYSLASCKEVATLLLAQPEPKLEKAKIKVESIIREESIIDVLDILELYGELMLARFGLIEKIGVVDPSIEEAYYTLIYVTSILSDDIKELLTIRELLLGRLGKEKAKEVSDMVEELAAEKVVMKLSNRTPDPTLVNSYIKEIGKNFKVPAYMDKLEPKADNLLDLDSDLLGPAPEQDKLPEFSDLPQLPKTIGTSEPKVNNLTPAKSGPPSFEELEARFNKLKNL